ncbi:MAG: Anthranilate synthase, amidotransferase component @ Para-aminobenzoate synthase, amidotransferase component, partial [uncultured Pseudonocardia sp.]
VSAIEHDGRGLFAGVAPRFAATRYHSLAVQEDSVPVCLQIAGRATDDGAVMALRHRTLPIQSVQFHPESVRTEYGPLMVDNFLASCSVARGGLRTA